MSCYSCDQSGSEAGDENDDDLCINPNPASDENPSTTLACLESDNKCASIRLVHHYGGKVAGERDDSDTNDQEDKIDDGRGSKNVREDKNYKDKERKDEKTKNNQDETPNDQDDNKKEREAEIGKVDKKNREDDDDEDERRKRSSVIGGDTSFVEIARKGCTSEKRVKAALDCFRNLFHHPYQRYLGKCTVTQFGREGFLMIKQKCEPGTLPKDMRVDMDRQDKFYLLLCTCEGDLCNDKELLELDRRVFIPEVKVVGNGTPWDEGWGKLGSGGTNDDDDNDAAMRKKFKSGGEIRKAGWLLLLAAVGVVVARGKF